MASEDLHFSQMDNFYGHFMSFFMEHPQKQQHHHMGSK